MRVILFALTGFGNNALECILRKGLELVAVFTEKEPEGEYPYYPCLKIHHLAKRERIELYAGLNIRDKESIDIIRSISPDIIIVSSFNQIIPDSIIRIPKKGVINVHPSLLPAYRGATPTFWTIARGERYTGVTIHFIEDQRVDSGRIIFQDRMEIDPEDTDGCLRCKLARLSEETLLKSIDLVFTKDIEEFEPQDESKATFFPKRSSNITLDFNNTRVDIANLVRASLPYPGALFWFKDEGYRVDHVDLLKGNNYQTEWVIKDKEIIINARDGFLRLYTNKL